MKNIAMIIIVGPTASGKSELAVKIAKKVDGEIVSADSRQVYRGLNIGTGKVPGKWEKTSLATGRLSLAKDQRLRTKGAPMFVYKSSPHHCIDFVSPKRQYTVADFKIDGQNAIQDILSRGKIPIICGGTGLYIDALVFDQYLPGVPPDEKFRKQMETKSAAYLFALLQKQDLVRAGNIDKHNKRRLIRALEIIRFTGKPVPAAKNNKMDFHLYVIPDTTSKVITTLNNNIAEAIRNPAEIEKIGNYGQIGIQMIYLNPKRKLLYQKIKKRLKERLKNGMIKEVERLHKAGITWHRCDDLGLEYKYVSRYLRGKINYQEMHEQLLQEIKNYSKRQETWFRKYENKTKSKI